MLTCLETPQQQLEKVLKKLYRAYEDCDTESKYITSQLKDRKKFEECIKEAITKIYEANDCITKISSTYPYYTPYKELTWVSEKEFEENKGKLLETDTAGFSLIVKRYENGEWHLYEDSSKYGLYVDYDERGI